MECLFRSSLVGCFRQAECFSIFVVSLVSSQYTGFDQNIHDGCCMRSRGLGWVCILRRLCSLPCFVDILRVLTLGWRSKQLQNNCYFWLTRDVVKKWTWPTSQWHDKTWQGVYTIMTTARPGTLGELTYPAPHAKLSVILWMDQKPH